jgi:hypothetical protein
MSSAGTPVFFIPKNDGAMSICIDYLGLNLITKKNHYPLLSICKVIDRVPGTQFFSKLDICNAYPRIRIQKGDELKTAFQMFYDHFKYNVVMFG